MATPSPALRGAFLGTSRALLARRAWRLAGFCFAFGVGLIFMVPFLWTVSSSLKPVDEIHLFPPSWLPSRPQWVNYVQVFDFAPFARWLLNTVIITVSSLIGTILSSSIVAYSFARFRYPGRDVFFLITLSTMMLPVEVTIIPQYLLFNKIGWLNTFKPLIVPHYLAGGGGGAFNVFRVVTESAESAPLSMKVCVPVNCRKPKLPRISTCTYLLQGTTPRVSFVMKRPLLV